MTPARRIESACLSALTLALCLSSTVLMLAEGSFFPVGLTPVIAVAALWLNDRRRLLVLPTVGANIAGIASISAAVGEILSGGSEARILALVHLVAYLTWVVLFMEKRTRQLWWLLALSVLHLALSTTLTKSPMLGPALVTSLIVEVWTLTLFTLHRLQQRVTRVGQSVDVTGRESQTISVRHGIQTDAGVEWIGPRLRLMVAAMCGASLMMSGVVFAVFPRVFVGSPFATSDDSSSVNPGVVNRTGFRETVRLGEFGTILQSDERVLQIDVVRQQTEEPVSIDEFAQAIEVDELLLRGTAMGSYADGEWTRAAQSAAHFGEGLRRQFGQASSTADCFRVRIVQDPPVGNFAFAPAPIIAARMLNTKGRIAQREFSHTLVFDLDSWHRWGRDQSTRVNEQSVTFEVYCPLPSRHQQQAAPPLLTGALRSWLFPNAATAGQLAAEDKQARNFAISTDLQQTLPQLHQYSMQLCETGGNRLPASECADRIVHLLRDSNEYTYSLTLPGVPENRDPVEEFLFTTKTGHCQYFASAAALMLQCLGIPARIVNGFKGFEVNGLTGANEVRQKHAHVWVEYWDQYSWHRIDPTPGSRDDAIAATQGANVLSNLQNAVSDLWQAGMNNVTADRQREFIAPILRAVQETLNEIRRRGIVSVLWGYVQVIVANSWQWFSWRVLLAVVAITVPVAVVSRKYTLGGLHRIVNWLRIRRNPRQRAATTIVRFYESFRKVCAKEGFHFEATHTAVENAANACQYFADRLNEQTQTIPGRIADAFNAVRYGDHILTEEQATALGDELGVLTAQIRKPASNLDDRSAAAT